MILAGEHASALLLGRRLGHFFYDNFPEHVGGMMLVLSVGGERLSPHSGSRVTESRRTPANLSSPAWAVRIQAGHWSWWELLLLLRTRCDGSCSTVPLAGQEPR